jgi:predicted nucleic acid-binding protein
MDTVGIRELKTHLSHHLKRVRSLYLDTSSLVKLYVTESGSEAVRQLVGDATVVATSVVAYAEMRAALARLRRAGMLTASKFTSAKREFDDQWATYLSLDVTDSLCLAAGDLAEKHRLRGFDSIHLASFAEVSRRAGTDDTRFSSFDDRLNDAARKVTRTLERSQIQHP